MFEKILQILSLACKHKHTSQPFTAAHVTTAVAGGWDTITGATTHYIVCLDCGKKIAYDWANMRRVR